MHGLALPERWSRGQRLKNTSIYHAIRVLVALTSWLPLWLTASFGGLLGRLGYYLNSGDRRRALRHLELAYNGALTPGQRRHIARGMFAHLGRAAGEALHARLVMQLPERHVAFTPGSRQRYQAALARGRGVILVSGHIGNWELLAAVLSPISGPLHAVARQTYDPRLTKLAHDHRTRAGFHLLWRGDRPLKQNIYDVLAQGEVLLLMIDQDIKGVPGVFVDFFGQPAFTPRAPATMALKTGATLMVGHLVRLNGRHVMDLQEVSVSAAADKPDREQAVVDLIQQMSAYLERAIRAHPEQWVWLHQRWKTQQ